MQFVDPAYPHQPLTFLALGTMAEIASITYLTALIFCGTRLAESFRRRRALSAGATTAVGGIFLAFAIKLTLAHA